jgi:hypothetical protein
MEHLKTIVWVAFPRGVLDQAVSASTATRTMKWSHDCTLRLPIEHNDRLSQPRAHVFELWCT